MNDIMKNDIGAIRLTANGMQIQTVAQVFGFAQLMAQANMLPPKTTIEGAVISIIAGARLGLDPFQSVQGITSIKGRPSLWGDALVAVVKASGMIEDEKVEKFRAANGNVEAVRVTVKRKGIATPIVGEFSRKMAEQSGLWNKVGLSGQPSPWVTYPERMLLNRARAYAYRDGFADVLRGMRFAEEEKDNEMLEQPPTRPAPRKRVRASAAEVLAVEETPSVDVLEAPPVEIVEQAQEQAQAQEEIIPIPE